MLIVNLCNQGDIYKQDNNNDTFSGDSDDSDKNMLDVFICLVYITSWLTMLTILDWQMRGAFVGIYAKALGFLVLGLIVRGNYNQNAVGISMRFV
jgi:hypothetical protein